MGNRFSTLPEWTRKGVAVAFGILSVTPSLGATSEDVGSYCSYLESAEPGTASSDGLGLCEALSTALKASPDLESLRLGVEAGDGRLTQASLTPNPSLDA
jgi:hypothetical protein